LTTAVTLLDKFVGNMKTHTNIEEIFQYIGITGISKCYLLDENGKILFQTTQMKPRLPKQLSKKMFFYGNRWVMQRIKKGDRDYYLLLNIKPFLYASTKKLYPFFWFIRAIIYLLFIIIGISLYLYPAKYSQKSEEKGIEFFRDTLQGMIKKYKNDISQLESDLKKYKGKEPLIELGANTRKILHEIRNRTGTIIGYVSLVKDKEVKNKLTEEVQFLNRVADNILIFTHPLEKKGKSLDIRKVLDYVLNDYKKNMKIGRHYQIVKKINGDKELLIQAFQNIVKNSYESMGKGEKKIDVHIRQKGNGVDIIIQDYGIGMNKKTAERIFEPDFTTKDKGTGLGMAYVKRIIDVHNGKIEVESKKGKGTKITVELV